MYATSPSFRNRARVAALALLAGATAAATGDPQIVHVGLVRPDVLAIVIDEGEVVRGSLVPYTAQPGDRIEEKAPEERGVRWVVRGGMRIGALSGRSGKIMRTVDTFAGRRMDRDLIGRTASYRLSRVGGAALAAPAAVHRKTAIRSTGESVDRKSVV